MSASIKKTGVGSVILALLAISAAIQATGLPEERLLKPASAANVDSAVLRALKWRAIGPAHFSGRVSDVAGVPGDPDVIYVGFSTAGLFKSTNGGVTFDPILDSATTLSVGAIAVAPSNPDILYVGTGEGNLRNSVSYGDGVYKSADGGKSWTRIGLEKTERIARIAVHPRNPETVYVAALGHEWGPNPERGLYRSTDGGRAWTNVLFVNETTGASDVAVDPEDPDILYCGMYDYLRRPWHFRSGGPGGGLYRSADGGLTWTKLTDPKLENGLPGKGLIGRIGVSVCASSPRTVYAMIESEEPGELWRSDDRGLNWTMMSDDGRINNRPFYYCDVHAAPDNPNRVYALASTFFVSADGGRRFLPVGGYGSLFGDHHALWIDPSNPRRMLNGNDGGAYESHDFGQTWRFLNNMPSAQAYHVGADMAEPYNVMGGFQDHEIWVGPSSKWNEVGVRAGDWRRLRDMADGMYALADPRDPNIIYYNGHFGDITRVDLRNTEERYIQPYPVGPTGTGAHMDRFRFQWNSPIHISPSNPDVVYYGGNVVFKASDGGRNWSTISPDLTTNDKSKQQLSGGPITPDNTRAEWHCAILSLSESPLNPKVLWASTDDGNVELTRDGGANWTNLSPNIQGLPKEAWIASVSASPHTWGGAVIAVDQHRLDDFAPYAFKTTDFGLTWTPIAAGLTGYVHIVKEDPRTAGLLYAGTELGIFASFDGGGSWTDLSLGERIFSVVDLLVHPRDNDLVLGTHSRGYFILDDVTPLQRLASSMAEPVALFPPIPPVRYTPASDTSTVGDQFFVAPNKPYGAVISYRLAAAEPGGKAEVEILDSQGNVLRTIPGPAAAGLNRVIWDLREDPRALLRYFKDDPAFRLRLEGFKVLPGQYTVRLKAASRVVDQKLTVRPDPRIKASPGDLAAYEAAVRRMLRMSVDIGEALARALRQDEKWAAEEAAASGERKAGIAAARAVLAAARDKLQPPRRQPENLNLQGKLSWLLRQVRDFTGRPTQPQTEMIDLLDRELREVLKEIEAALAAQVPRVS